MDTEELTPFTFHTSLGRGITSIPLTFRETQGLPHRINAITGPNGAGKTTLLRNLYSACHGTHDSGTFTPYRPSFTNIALSGHDPLSPLTPATAGAAKSMDEQITEHLRNLPMLTKRPNLEPVFRLLAEGTSFKNAGANPFHTPEKTLTTWPTSHKLAASILANLGANLIPGSLAIMEEPELHLSPPLQATLIRAISLLLHNTLSIAVISTSSPVVLQEIPSHQVHILRRYGTVTNVEHPTVETYGENIGIITRHVLQLDPTKQRYMEVTNELAGRLTEETIEAMFRCGMSSQVRALVMQKTRSRRQEE